MKIALANAALAMALVAAMPATAQDETARAKTPVALLTGIWVTIPDKNGKVPNYDDVPGSAIATFSDGFPQAFLTGGNYYEYCVTVASSNSAGGTGSIAYKITRGKTVIQTATVVSSFKIGPDGVWYWCAGYQQLPKSPGAATITATMTYTPTTGAPEKSTLSTKLLLQ